MAVSGPQSALASVRPAQNDSNLIGCADALVSSPICPSVCRPEPGRGLVCRALCQRVLFDGLAVRQATRLRRRIHTGRGCACHNDHDHSRDHHGGSRGCAASWLCRQLSGLHRGLHTPDDRRTELVGVAAESFQHLRAVSALLLAATCLWSRSTGQPFGVHGDADHELASCRRLSRCRFDRKSILRNGQRLSKQQLHDECRRCPTRHGLPTSNRLSTGNRLPDSDSKRFVSVLQFVARHRIPQFVLHRADHLLPARNDIGPSHRNDRHCPTCL